MPTMFSRNPGVPKSPSEGGLQARSDPGSSFDKGQGVAVMMERLGFAR
jgi:hypothetical protein